MPVGKAVVVANRTFGRRCKRGEVALCIYVTIGLSPLLFSIACRRIAMALAY